MGIYDNEWMKAVARRTMTIYFIIDTSWSMRNQRMGAVNQALAETIPLIREISSENADAQIHVAILTYSTRAEWIAEPTPVESFCCPRISAQGQTNFKEACVCLEAMLARQASANHGAGCYAPVFILLADGGSNAYKTVLKKLWSNSWFSHGIKVAIAIGDEAKFEMLADFTGCRETVLRVHNRAQLKKIIQFVSVQSSQIGSKSSNVQGNPMKRKNRKSQALSASSGALANISGNRQTLDALSSSNQPVDHKVWEAQMMDSIKPKQEILAEKVKMLEPDDDGSLSVEDWEW